MLTGDGKLRIALGSTSGSEFDSLCQPSTTYTDDNGRGTVNGVKCTQGVTLHLTYHTSSVPASKCNAAGWDEIMEDCQTVQLTCGGRAERPCLCDEVRRPCPLACSHLSPRRFQSLHKSQALFCVVQVCAETLDSFNRHCIGIIDGLATSPVDRVR